MGTQNAKPFGRWCPITRVENVNGHKVKRHGSTDSASTELKVDQIKQPTRNEEEGRRKKISSHVFQQDTIT